MHILVRWLSLDFNYPSDFQGLRVICFYATVTGDTTYRDREMEWQPIETAPKDGTEILLYDGFGLQVCRYGFDSVHNRVKLWVYGDTLDQYNTRLDMADPTHWMPLPEPPND